MGFLEFAFIIVIVTLNIACGYLNQYKIQAIFAESEKWPSVATNKLAPKVLI